MRKQDGGGVQGRDTRQQELLLAKTIQDSSLPRKFDFNHKGFEVYAAMDPLNRPE